MEIAVSKRPLLLVLAHGIFGWGEPAGGGNQLKEYYYGVRPLLEREYGKRDDLSLTIIAPTVRAAESVAVRGQDLAEAIGDQLKTMPTDARAHIIAHSMGGLDARWVLTQPGMADKIASLTTIATPHQGTTLGNIAYDFRTLIRPIGDVLESFAELKGTLRRLLHQRGLDVDDTLEFYHHLLANVVQNSTPEAMERGLRALTLQGATEFNERLAPSEQTIRNRTKHQVAYFAYGGVLSTDVVPLLKPANDVMRLLATHREKEIGNDGAVSVWSAHFPWDDAGHDYVETLPYDHFSQINWRIPDTRPSDEMPADLQAVYRNMMNRILSITS